MGAHGREGVFSLRGSHIIKKSISIVAAWSVVRFFLPFNTSSWRLEPWLNSLSVRWNYCGILFQSNRNMAEYMCGTPCVPLAVEGVKLSLIHLVGLSICRHLLNKTVPSLVYVQYTNKFPSKTTALHCHTLTPENKTPLSTHSANQSPLGLKYKLHLHPTTR